MISTYYAAIGYVTWNSIRVVPPTHTENNNPPFYGWSNVTPTADVAM